MVMRMIKWMSGVTTMIESETNSRGESRGVASILEKKMREIGSRCFGCVMKRVVTEIECRRKEREKKTEIKMDRTEQRVV